MFGSASNFATYIAQWQQNEALRRMGAETYEAIRRKAVYEANRRELKLGNVIEHDPHEFERVK